MTRRVAYVLALAALGPSMAHAYSDPATFADMVDVGGGGGRFFTGSPRDGYTCKVCHGGGHDPQLLILGLPVGGYRPAVSYEVTVTWPRESENLGLEAEFTDGSGKTAGSLRVPPQAELLPPELCLPVTAGVAAAMLSKAGARTVVSVPDCGARRLRMLWTAPAQDVGAVWFTGSVVTSDAQGDVKGDGVTDFTRLLPSPSSPDALASSISAGCRVASLRHAPVSDALCSASAGACFGLLLLYRRRRARRRTD
jgi:hypothetical protein